MDTNMNETALILMATYNGERYLNQQIESIINQTYLNWKLLVRDDGSQDKTMQILQSYSLQDNRIEILQNNTDKHGAYLNFWTLIYKARKEYFNFDYYFFSDQDDVWEPDKLEVMINNSKNFSHYKPVLVYSDMRVIDENSMVIHNSLNKIMGIGEMRGYSIFFTHGFLWGCNICINNALFNNLPLLPLEHPFINIMSHDNYIGKYALLEGQIKYINTITINHRRHSTNSTGGYYMKLSKFKIIKRGLFNFDDLSKTHARVYNQTLFTLDIFENNNIHHSQAIVNTIRKIILNGGFKSVIPMIRLGVWRKQLSRTMGIYLVIISCSYKKYLEV